MSQLRSFLATNSLSITTTIGIIILGLAAGWLIHFFAFKALRLWFAQNPQSKWPEPIIKNLYRPSKTLLYTLVPLLFLPALKIDQTPRAVIVKILTIAFISTLAWVAIKSVHMFKDIVLLNYDVTSDNNLTARKIHTQFKMLTSIATSVIILLMAASMLMSFEKVRQVGMSLLASAGIASVVIGFAAQKSIATVLAGIQIAFTQPIRLDDVVIVENEWGWIEEITLTYVVVRIWDLRRLIVPINYFIENPFQNWTRTSAEILGTVSIYADYKIPVGKIRDALTDILKNTPLWDGKVNCLQVTGATSQTLELRALMSAKNSGKAWDLRCLVREKLIEYMQQNLPEHLPKTRVTLESGPQAATERTAT